MESKHFKLLFYLGFCLLVLSLFVPMYYIDQSGEFGNDLSWIWIIPLIYWVRKEKTTLFFAEILEFWIISVISLGIILITLFLLLLDFVNNNRNKISSGAFKRRFIKEMIILVIVFFFWYFYYFSYFLVLSFLYGIKLILITPYIGFYLYLMGAGILTFLILQIKILLVCPSCGKELKKGTKFCGKCGTFL